jgi:hypothetical protein
MPKSAFSASNQAKICAAAIITALAGVFGHFGGRRQSGRTEEQ